MELTAQLSDNDLLVAGGVVVIALIAFIAVLWLSTSEKKKDTAGGSAFVANEDGQVVRRSTRRVLLSQSGAMGALAGARARAPHWQHSARPMQCGGRRAHA